MLDMPPQRNMAWRKPVPKFIPDSSSSLAARLSTSIQRLSIAHATEGPTPPAPGDWVQQVGDAMGSEKRHAFVLDSEVTPAWMEEYLHHPLSLPAVPPAQHAGEDATCDTSLRAASTLCGSPPQQRLQGLSTQLGRQDTEKIAITSGPLRSKRSLPRHYRPPTPPLPRDHAKRRRPNDAHPSNNDQHGIAPHLLSSDAWVAGPFTLSASTPSSQLWPNHSVTAVNSLEDLQARSHMSYASTLPKLSQRRTRRISSTFASWRSNRTHARVSHVLKSIGAHVRTKVTLVLRLECTRVSY